MTEHRSDGHDADAQLARIEALRQRRPSRTGASAAPPTSARPARRLQRRRHPAARSRVGVAAFSVATMLGLVGVMGLARPASSADPAPGHTQDAAPLPTSASAAVAAAVPGIGAPPVTLTARPTVRVTTAPPTAPAARTNGSH